MKLFAEIQTLPSDTEDGRHDSYPVRVSLEEGVVTVEAFLGAQPMVLHLLAKELEQALRAVAGTPPARAEPDYAAALAGSNRPGALQQSKFTDMHDLRANMRARKALPSDEEPAVPFGNGLAS